LKLLLSDCVPRPLRNYFPGHEVHTTYERGWAAFQNGALLTAAENDGFSVLVTTDQNLPYQQNSTGRQIAILVLVARSNRVPELVPLIPDAVSALELIQPGQIIKIGFATR
jgi:hypothetical protein